MSAKVAMRSLSNLRDLDQAIARSHDRAALVFKHSLTCPVSARAFREVTNLLSAPALPADVYLVCVQCDRRVSDAIAERLGTRHESPQAILLSRGEVVWSDSHFGITEKALRTALEHYATANV